MNKAESNLHTYAKLITEKQDEALESFAKNLSDEEAQALVEELVNRKWPILRSLTYNYEKQYWRVSPKGCAK